jgi:hypothetical protein
MWDRPDTNPAPMTEGPAALPESSGKDPTRDRRRPTWIWPFPVPRRLAQVAWRATGLAARLYDGWMWLPVAVAAGAIPVLIGISFGLSGHQPVTAILLFLLFIAAVRENRLACGVAVVGIVFAAHSLPVIALTIAGGDTVAASLPDAEGYWQANLRWIVTGHDPEYEIVNWLPAHLQLLGAIIVLGYLSMGLIPFYQGFYEVDLMNYYVGRLVTESAGSPLALLCGWHIWSLTRGLCYTVLVFEIAQCSLARLSGRRLASRAARIRRWSVALGFFLVDCGLKLFLTEPVRGLLEQTLPGP